MQVCLDFVIEDSSKALMKGRGSMTRLEAQCGSTLEVRIFQ